MKSIDYLALGTMLGLLGALLILHKQDLRYGLITFVGIAFMIYAIIKNEK